jgi:hypothetical protein
MNVTVQIHGGRAAALPERSRARSRVQAHCRPFAAARAARVGPGRPAAAARRGSGGDGLEEEHLLHGLLPPRTPSAHAVSACRVGIFYMHGDVQCPRNVYDVIQYNIRSTERMSRRQGSGPDTAQAGPGTAGIVSRRTGTPRGQTRGPRQLGGCLAPKARGRTPWRSGAADEHRTAELSNANKSFAHRRANGPGPGADSLAQRGGQAGNEQGASAPRQGARSVDRGAREHRDRGGREGGREMDERARRE